MNVPFQATLNATLNLISAILLLLGYVQIKGGRPERHKRFMIAALVSSICFLTSYVIYHASAGSVPYPHHDWTRTLYFAILIPHVILAAAMVPFIILAVYYAFRETFDRHTRITRWLWPVWMFVSISGVVVYLMLYHL
jgi:putative membrane protein